MTDTTQTEGDDHDKPERRVWQCPRVRRLRGADAENFEGPVLDGPIVQS